MIIGIGGRRVCLWGYKGVHLEGGGAFGVIRWCIWRGGVLMGL